MRSAARLAAAASGLVLLTACGGAADTTSGSSETSRLTTLASPDGVATGADSTDATTEVIRLNEPVEIRPVLEVSTLGDCPSGVADVYAGNEYCYGLGDPAMVVTEVYALDVEEHGSDTWTVTLTLTADDASTFADLTTQTSMQQEPENRLALVVMNRVLAAPAVTAPLTYGQVPIDGGYDSADAVAVAEAIRFGLDGRTDSGEDVTAGGDSARDDGPGSGGTGSDGWLCEKLPVADLQQILSEQVIYTYEPSMRWASTGEYTNVYCQIRLDPEPDYSSADQGELVRVNVMNSAMTGDFAELHDMSIAAMASNSNAETSEAHVPGLDEAVFYCVDVNHNGPCALFGYSERLDSYLQLEPNNRSPYNLSKDQLAAIASLYVDNY